MTNYTVTSDGVQLPVVPEPQPDPLFRDNVVVGEPDCEAGTITTVTTNESAGYYLGNDGQWWLGEYFPTGDPVTTVDAVAEGVCPAEQVIPEPEVPQVPEPIEAPTITTTPIAPVAVQTDAPELAKTGSVDPTMGLVLALGAVLTGGVMMLRKVVR